MDAINGLAGALQPAASPSTPVAKAQSAFSDLLQGMITDTNAQQQAADSMIQQLQAGGEVSLHDAMIAMEKADISLRYMVQVRNKAIEAYQEIMRIQM